MLYRFLSQGKGASTEHTDDLLKFLQLVSQSSVFCLLKILKRCNWQGLNDTLQVKYVSGSYDSEDGFLLLNKEISAHESSRRSQPGTSRRLFYLALPPSVYPLVCKMIRRYCMNQCKIIMLWPITNLDSLTSSSLIWTLYHKYCTPTSTFYICSEVHH